MKIILLSDVHLCVEKPIGRLDNDMLLTGLSKLDYVFGYAHEHNIENILQAGDFVDVKRSWELLAALTKFLAEWRIKGVHLYTVQGQHDSYYHLTTNEKTIVGVLIFAGLVTMLNRIPLSLGEKGLQIYGSSYGEEIPFCFDKNCLNILVCHRQILMKKEWAQDNKLSQDTIIDRLVLAILQNRIELEKDYKRSTFEKCVDEADPLPKAEREYRPKTKNRKNG